MYIGKAAQLSGTTVKSIRHYEAIGLLPPAQRQGNYRLYDQDSVERLMFIKCAQQLGFKLKELQALFAQHQSEAFPWELARQALAEKRQELTRQIEAMQHLHARLEHFETSLEQARHDCRLGNL
ncbi:transcriptional regulator, MerR family [Pseudomonas sp. LAMO17WK12:I10]|uniref:MerR family transcriptional regulator n=1 Tax=unclassified Pseudomonas TaxID=196821 RepID=UPI000BD95642|nr:MULTISPECIES: MerR family transcriptional regulator [unclassified Pseudomonas]PXX52734.1 DNA-binding transcriptional MerR regulator [Pseudomonas sp. LAMO17WK12:I9]SNY52783.1 transcriptional regulator, MerR family [Pseudomonas sp. LAMO17WK12:I10]